MSTYDIMTRGIQMKKSLPKPRNPFVAHIRMKPSGPHVKSKKVYRRNDKVNLKKELCNEIK